MVILFPTNHPCFSDSGALENELNKKGNEGWELVSIINHPEPKGFYL
jgi:hypothetical protein